MREIDILISKCTASPFSLILSESVVEECDFAVNLECVRVASVKNRPSEADQARFASGGPGYVLLKLVLGDLEILSPVNHDGPSQLGRVVYELAVRDVGDLCLTNIELL